LSKGGDSFGSGAEELKNRKKKKNNEPNYCWQRRTEFHMPKAVK